MGQTSCNSLLKSDRVLLPFLWSLSVLSLFPLFSYHLPSFNTKWFLPLSANISTRSLLPRLLDQRSSPCTPPKWFNFWFILIIYGLNIFPSEKSIPWMKKKKGFCCCWCSFVLYFNNVPRGTNMLKFLSIYLKESSHLKKIHMSKLVSSLWIAKVSLKG